MCICYMQEHRTILKWSYKTPHRSTSAWLPPRHWLYREQVCYDFTGGHTFFQTPAVIGAKHWRPEPICDAHCFNVLIWGATHSSFSASLLLLGKKKKHVIAMATKQTSIDTGTAGLQPVRTIPHIHWEKGVLKGRDQTTGALDCSALKVDTQVK